MTYSNVEGFVIKYQWPFSQLRIGMVDYFHILPLKLLLCFLTSDHFYRLKWHDFKRFNFLQAKHRLWFVICTIFTPSYLGLCDTNQFSPCQCHLSVHCIKRFEICNVPIQVVDYLDRFFSIFRNWVYRLHPIKNFWTKVIQGFWFLDFDLVDIFRLRFFWLVVFHFSGFERKLS